MTSTSPTTPATTTATPPTEYVVSVINGGYFDTAAELANNADKQARCLAELKQAMAATKQVEQDFEQLIGWYRAHGLTPPHAGEEHITEHKLKRFHEDRLSLGPFGDNCSTMRIAGFDLSAEAMGDLLAQDSRRDSVVIHDAEPSKYEHFASEWHNRIEGSDYYGHAVLDWATNATGIEHYRSAGYTELKLYRRVGEQAGPGDYIKTRNNTMREPGASPVSIDESAPAPVFEHKLYSEKASEVRTTLAEAYKAAELQGWYAMSFGQLCDVMNLLEPVRPPEPIQVDANGAFVTVLHSSQYETIKEELTRDPLADQIVRVKDGPADLYRYVGRHGDLAQVEDSEARICSIRYDTLEVVPASEGGYPDYEEPEGSIDDLRPLIEYPARRLTLTFTHPTIGDEIFTTELLKAIGEFTIYMAKVELPSDPYEAPAEPRYPFTASNGVVVDVLAWKTVEEQGGLPAFPFVDGDEQLAFMTETIRAAAASVNGLCGLPPRAATTSITDREITRADIDKLVATLRDDSYTPAAANAFAEMAVSGKSLMRTSVDASGVKVEVMREQDKPVTAEEEEAFKRMTESPPCKDFAPRPDMLDASPIRPVHANDIDSYTFDEFLDYGRSHSPASMVNGMPWSFAFHGYHATHETDDHYIIGAAYGDSYHFRRGDRVSVREGHLLIHRTVEKTPVEPSGNRRVFVPGDIVVVKGMVPRTPCEVVSYDAARLAVEIRPCDGTQSLLFTGSVFSPWRLELASMGEAAKAVGQMNAVEHKATDGGRNEGYEGLFIEDNETLKQRAERLVRQGWTPEHIKETEGYLSIQGAVVYPVAYVEVPADTTKAEIFPVMKPDIGRRVWFRPDPRSVQSGFRIIDYKTPLDAGVVYVWNDGTVNLDVTDHYGRHHAFDAVNLLQPGEAPPEIGCYAEWMPFQIKQARGSAK